MPARFFLPRDVSRLLAHHGLGRYNLPMRNNQRSAPLHGTTVLCVRKDNKVVLVADGQVTVGEHVMKHTARKTRRLYNDRVLAGFAGSTADAITLFERFEGKLQEFSGNLQKAAVELAKEWRKDRALRHLEARSEEHTSELQSQSNLVCRLLLEKKKLAQEYKSHNDYIRVFV